MIRKHDECCPALTPFAVLLRDTPEDRERLIAWVTTKADAFLRGTLESPAEIADAIIEALRERR